MAHAVISYLRVSTGDQTVQNQRQAIANAGFTVDKEFADEAVSGSLLSETRPSWRSCIQYLRSSDTLVVYALHRISRSTVDVLTQINQLADNGVRLVILQQGFDTNTPSGRLALAMFAAFGEFEQAIRRERQVEGIRRARSEGKYRGRKPKLTDQQRSELRRRFADGENRTALAREFGVDRGTVHRYCSD